MSNTPKEPIPYTQEQIDILNNEEIDRQEKAIFDLASQGHVVSVDPELAAELGAFEEDALSVEDALVSRFDVDEKGVILDELCDDVSEVEGENNGE